jgi:hypothetical protein
MRPRSSSIVAYFFAVGIEFLVSGNKNAPPPPVGEARHERQREKERIYFVAHPRLASSGLTTLSEANRTNGLWSQ